MKSKRRLTIIFLGLCLIGLIYALVRCQLVPRPVCVSVRTPKSDQASNGFFVDHQMIVTGPRMAVNALLPNENLIVDCDLSFLSTRSFQATSAPKMDGKEKTEWLFADSTLTDQEQRKSLVMRLYEFPDIPNIEDEIFNVNDKGNSISVFADPNYLTSPVQEHEACGQPYSGGGSGGGPYGGPDIPSIDVSGDFLAQWALGQGGINLPILAQNEMEASQLPGHGIRIGVFDTSPFGNGTAPSGSSRPTPPPEFPAQPTDLELNNVTDSLTRPLRRQNNDLDYSDHGLFVAGLIHAMAPGSEIHWFRVLNDEGCGDLFTLNGAIIDFIEQMSSSEKIESSDLRNVVINLSLGVHRPDAMNQIKNNNTSHPVNWDRLRNSRLASLQTALGEANRLGAIIVAASGNDSAQTIASPQIPARYDVVIGVAASNLQSNRSCYSNRGDLAAPGGDGGQDPAGSDSCIARADTWATPPGPNDEQTTCSDMANCAFGLISLSQSLTGGPGYIYWAGSSFSTPLVTGLTVRSLERTNGNTGQAVCLMTKGASNAGSPTHPVDPDLGSGVINVSESLGLDPNVACP